MSVKPVPRLCRLPAALLASLMLGTLTGMPAAAQSFEHFSCRTGAQTGNGGPDARPVPRIRRYAVAAATDPTPAGGLREGRRAEVVGGDAARGWLRIDVEFDSAIPRDCVLPLLLTTAADRGSPGDIATASRMAEIFDGYEVIAGRPQIMAHLADATRFFGEGTHMASFRVPIRSTASTRPASHDLKLVLAGDYAGGLPLTVNVAPLPAFIVAAPAGPIAAGAVTTFRAEQPVALLPGTAAMPVTFRLSSQSLGRWQSGRAAMPTEVTGVWDDRFTPWRSEAIFTAAMLSQTSTGTVTVSFAGRSQTLPVTVAGAPARAASACDPVFTVVAVNNGLRLSVNNRGTGSCPAYRVRPRAFGKLAAPMAPVQAVLSLPTGIKPATGPVPAIRGAASESSTTFMFDKTLLGQLKPGTRFDFEIVPDTTDSSKALQGVAITLKEADIAIISAKKPG